MSTLFDTIYDADEKKLLSSKKGSVEQKIKRKLVAAFQNAQEQILDANMKRSAELDKLADANFNEIFENTTIVSQLEDQADAVKATYKELFNTELPETI